ncbi:dTMP kinase [Longispora sp. NPDC051575]|uniref:dTMP kinase n=1 Tax=Longispora sp. NPDC051575 TaxID=3154943 RepID=UPI0034317C7E
MSSGADVRAILRIRPFRRLWLVLSLSSFGDWLGLMATAIFATAQVNSSAAKGAAFGGVIAIRLLPALVLGPIAGVFADRFDRRYTMVVCDILRFVLFASIPLVGTIADNAGVAISWAAIATFLIEAVGMIWAPAKEASVPNLLPKGKLERANQLSLVMTYGVAPVSAALTIIVVSSLLKDQANTWASSSNIALYFNALTFLAAAVTVFFGIKEISGRSARQAKGEGVLTQFLDGWRYVGRTPLVRGLVFGMLGAFAGAGVVIGAGPFYAESLGGGDASFGMLFGSLFIGLAVGIALGPRIIGTLSRKRWFGASIVMASCAVFLLAISPHLAIAVFGALLVGSGAGMAFLAGTTMLGTEIGDEVRGRVFGFIWTAVRVVLMLSISLSATLAGFGGTRLIFGAHISFTRILLAAAGIVGALAGVMAFRQMDDRRGVPVLGDIWGALTRRPLSIGEPDPGKGLFIVFEGGEGVGKSTQVVKLAAWLRLRGSEPVVTREPGATDIGMRIRGLVLDGKDDISPRAEALLYAADRAQHVSEVLRPALTEGKVVISDRYVDSSLAYQGAGRTMATDEISWLSTWATGALKPDLTILIDLDPAVGLTRAKARSGADRIESESLAFHERVRYAFLDLAGADAANYLVIDGTGDPEKIALEIRDRVDALLVREAAHV